jgi:hypothetical protein
MVHNFMDVCVCVNRVCVCVSICMYVCIYIHIYIYGQLGRQCAIYTGKNHQIYTTMLEMLIHLRTGLGFRV